MTCEYAGECKDYSYESGSVCLSESRETTCRMYKVYENMIDKVNEGLTGLKEIDMKREEAA